MKKIYLCTKAETVKNVYATDETVYTKDDVLSDPEKFKATEFIFSTWGMPTFTEDEIKEYLPSLKAVFYGAGSVQNFARPFLNCGVKVFSAWAANAVPVAEYTVAQIILANKGFFHTINKVKSKSGYLSAQAATKALPGNYKTSIGILGVGQIGRRVIEGLQKQTNSIIKVYDPYLSNEAAASMNVQKASLEEIFSTCQTISNHVANLPTTQKLFDYKYFSLMKDNAVFINTGRGAQVEVSGLIKALKEQPSRFAVLDVTDPTEPPEDDSELYKLDNLLITPHIAGSSGNEVHRMAELMLDAFRAVKAGKVTQTEVSLEMLDKMA
jgi:phosphoglycerate dehydrogenase-like enzyme